MSINLQLRNNINSDGKSERAERLLNKNLQFTILSLKLFDSLLQLKTLRSGL